MARYVVDLADMKRRPMTIGETRDLSRVGVLTVGEMQSVERGDYGSLPMSAMIGIVYILLRRRDPRFTEHDLNSLSWDDIDFVQSDGAADGPSDPPVPLQPLQRGGRKPSARSASTGA